MIKVISFDLGGVLFSDGQSMHEELKLKFNYEPDVVKKALSDKYYLHKGLMTEKEYLLHLQKKLPPGYEAEKIIKYWYDSYELDQDIFQLMQKLRSAYKIAAFSGNIRERIDYLEKKYKFRHLFDQEIYSFDCGYTKPEPEFFAHFVNSLQTDPKEILHVDDNNNSLEQLRPFEIDCLIYKRGNIKALLADLQARDIKI